MKKWTISAIVYLLVVIGGYTVYDAFVAEQQAPVSESEEN